MQILDMEGKSVTTGHDSVRRRAFGVRFVTCFLAAQLAFVYPVTAVYASTEAGTEVVEEASEEATAEAEENQEDTSEEPSEEGGEEDSTDVVDDDNAADDTDDTGADNPQDDGSGDTGNETIENGQDEQTADQPTDPTDPAGENSDEEGTGEEDPDKEKDGEEPSGEEDPDKEKTGEEPSGEENPEKEKDPSAPGESPADDGDQTDQTDKEEPEDPEKEDKQTEGSENHGKEAHDIAPDETHEDDGNTTNPHDITTNPSAEDTDSTKPGKGDTAQDPHQDDSGEKTDAVEGGIEDTGSKEQKGEDKKQPAKESSQDDSKKSKDANSSKEKESLMKETKRRHSAREKLELEIAKKAETNKATAQPASYPGTFQGFSSYSYPGIGSYYTGQYAPYNMFMNYSNWYKTLTEADRLLIGMTKIDKVPLAVKDKDVDILEETDSTARVVGKMSPGATAYLIEELDGGWAFIESGDVRGYARMDAFVLKEAPLDVDVEEDGKVVSAELIVSPLENGAYKKVMKTTKDIPQQPYRKLSLSRTQLVDYSMQFLGRPYVWGGEDLWNGTDCSGFTQGLYGHFGYSLPRCSYEQCYAGTKIDPKDALPGDLLFYARNGVVYHVLMYIGNGQAINAQSSSTGIVISDVKYDKVCWGVRVIDSDYSSTQAADLVQVGMKATNGDKEAQQEIISTLAKASEKEWENYGFTRSVIIAQAIKESGWLSFKDSVNNGVQPEDNNILGMNADLLNDEWESPWTGSTEDRNVPQYVNGENVYGPEPMRTYEDIESCLEDYAAFKIGMHPELQNSNDVESVVDTGLQGYATDPEYQESIVEMVDKYDLDRFDVDETVGENRKDATTYTQEELELIWAIVEQEDSSGYEGALAVISSVMNRADKNYGSYGTTALEQLTAPGQYCYVYDEAEEPVYQQKLGGNVSEEVKQAVRDCLENGVRNHEYQSFRSSNRTGTMEQIGDNWYF